jgi:uncharacterized OB-fold protein
MTTHERIPVAEGLFAETAAGPRLLGSRCQTCSTPYFPRSAACHNPGCEESRMEDTDFGPRGRLWSCAIQNYPPPPPARYDEPYTPYAVGVVDLDEGLRVVARMSVDDPESLQLGAEVELTIEPIYRDAEGRDVTTWKFKPL